MIFLRSALFNGLFFCGTALAAVLGLPLLFAAPARLIAYVRLWARGVLWLLQRICRIHLVVSGLERIPAGAAIIASKHQSAFDTILWLVLLEAPAYVLKRELFALPVWGWLAWRCGHIAVDRRGGGAALRRLVRKAQKRLAEGRPVVIFPEGTRTLPGERRPYQPGVAAVALATAVPVVPVATDSGFCWPRRSFLKYPGSIHVVVLPPLSPGLSRRALLAALEASIEKEIGRLMAARAVDNVGDNGAIVALPRPENRHPTA